jgi:hypothetical protein
MPRDIDDDPPPPPPPPRNRETHGQPEPDTKEER